MTKMPKWKELKFKPQWRTYKLYQKPIEVSAIDTETLNGDVKVIATPDRVAEVETYLDVMKFLTSSHLEGKAVFLWNLRYDVEAIFRYNQDAQYALAYHGKFEDDRYDIRYIPERKLWVKEKLGHRGTAIKMYDLAQFYHMALEDASKKYLGLEPRNIKEDRARLFELHTLEEIKAYCQEDARRTAEIGRHFVSGFTGIGFYPRSFISSGTIASDYATRHAEIPMTFRYLPYDVGRAYYQAYRGGWFELFRRGRMNVYAYDIVSAYPYALRQLPDIRDGEWVPFDERLEYGVVKVRIDRSLTDINPLGFRTPSGMYYPNIIEPVKTWMTAREYRAFDDYYEMTPIVYDHSDVVGWSFQPFRSYYRRPFEKVVDALYEIKRVSPKESPEYMVAKTIMNALYGKTIEKRKENEEMITGQLFNPFYAAEITATPRVMIADAVFGRRDDLVMISTDSIHALKPLSLPIGRKLGDWSVEAENKDGIYVFNGIYAIAGAASHIRGFSRRLDLFKILDTDKYEVEIKLRHVNHAREAYRQGKMPEVGQFCDIVKKITTIPDGRHLWKARAFTLRDLLRQNYGSMAMPSSLVDIEEDDDETYDLQGVWKV